MGAFVQEAQESIRLKNSEGSRRLPMPKIIPHGVYDLRQYKEQARVFRDRQHAGKVLAGMLQAYQHDMKMIHLFL